MGKRSNFQRVEKDFYPTPYEAVLPLLPHLSPQTEFIEPCAGDGRLVKHFELNDHRCIWQSDAELDATSPETKYPDGLIITNPPWSRQILHRLIEVQVISKQHSAWLLFDADWAHTKQAMHYLEFCTDIVSVGRVKWIEDSKMTGKDNVCWYRFQPTMSISTIFHPRKCYG